MHNVLLTTFLLACTGTDSDTSDSALVRTPGEDETVHAFATEHVYFGDQDRRTVDVEVSFPDASNTYSAIQGRMALTCPDDDCDHWDRYGTWGVVLDKGTDNETYVEIDRFITPYRVGFDWEADLTELRAVLTGDVTLRVFIDTWVGPGHSQGSGWLFDAQLDFVGGEPPAEEITSVVPIWGHTSFHYGLDDKPVSEQVLPVEVSADTASQVTLRSFITGHGFGGNENCAEFCSKEHSYSLGDGDWDRDVWRDDCEDTITDGNQQGTWKYDRAGWCPGAQVFPWDMDATDHWTGDSVDVSYGVEDYTWDGSDGQPYYYMSGVLLIAE